MKATFPLPDVLYVERAASGHRRLKELAARLGSPAIVPIDSYTDVFHRPGQHFQAQKRSPAMVVAVAGGPLVYDAPGRVGGDESARLFYNDQVRNCLFNCDYCFLQGMHSSGYVLVFVNSEDYHAATARALTESAAPIWLNVSYLTDLVAFEEYLPLAGEWVEFSRKHSGITVELRTKSNAESLLESHAPSQNAVLTWTISPRPVTRRYESGASSLEERLDAARRAIEAGWRVRLALDPILMVPQWPTLYGEMIHKAFQVIPPDGVEAVSYGAFRMGTDFLDRIQRIRADSPILYHPFSRDHGLATYGHRELEAVRRNIRELLVSHLPDDRVHFVHG